MKARFSQLITALIILAVFLRPTAVYAETTSGGDSSGAAAGGSVELPDAPPQPSPVAVPKPQSRSSDSGASSALAMVGAMTAMAMCAKLMNDARKAQAEGDSKSAQMYSMMAMMQCQQAAQSAANSDKNKDQKNQLQENQTPQIAQPAAQKAPKIAAAPSDKVDQAGLNASPSSTSTSDASPDPEVAALRAPSPDLSGGDSVQIPPNYARPGDGFVIPDLVDKAKITGDESAKGVDGAGNLVPTTMNNSNSFAGALKSATSGDLKGTLPNDTPQTAVNTRISGSKNGGESSSEGASSSSKSSENGDGVNLNDMMAGLFGSPGGAAAAGFGGAQGLTDYANIPTSASTGKKMNIFEAASYLYQQANGKKVRKTKIAKNFKNIAPTQIAASSN